MQKLFVDIVAKQSQSVWLMLHSLFSEYTHTHLYTFVCFWICFCFDSFWFWNFCAFWLTRGMGIRDRERLKWKSRNNSTLYVCICVCVKRLVTWNQIDNIKLRRNFQSKNGRHVYWWCYKVLIEEKYDKIVILQQLIHWLIRISYSIYAYLLQKISNQRIFLW